MCIRDRVTELTCLLLKKIKALIVFGASEYIVLKLSSLFLSSLIGVQTFVEWAPNPHFFSSLNLVELF